MLLRKVFCALISLLQTLAVMDVSNALRRGEMAKHWSQMIQETLLSVGMEGALGINVQGGAENGQFCWVDSVDTSNVVFYSGRLHNNEIILEIQGQKVAGYTLHDLQEWLLLTTRNNNPVLVKTVLTGMYLFIYQNCS